MKNRLTEKLAAIACALCLTGGVMSGVVFAGAESAAGSPAPPEETFVVVAETPGWTPGSGDAVETTDNRTAAPYDVNGAAAGMCPIVGGMPWLGPEALLDALGLSYSGSTAAEDFTLTGDGFVLTAVPGAAYFVCSGRYFYVPGGVRTEDGRTLLPLESLAACLGVAAAWDRVSWNISITADGVHPLEDGDTYYAKTDVYWLSRLIYAEAGGRSLEEKLAVGDVVLNRVADESFAGQDSVYDVIFAKNQFDVVINGMIYMEPDEEAVIAAKLALEGFDITSGATVFATDGAVASLEYAARIGDYLLYCA